MSVVFTIEDLVWPEDGGIVECVVMTYTNNGSIEFIDSLIGNTSTSARLGELIWDLSINACRGGFIELWNLWIKNQTYQVSLFQRESPSF